MYNFQLPLFLNKIPFQKTQQNDTFRSLGTKRQKKQELRSLLSFSPVLMHSLINFIFLVQDKDLYLMFKMGICNDFHHIIAMAFA